jgi:hypothetical protein
MLRVQARAAATVVAILAAVTTAVGQTRVQAPDNKYSPADDVKLGLQASQEVMKEMPVMRDPEVNNYLERIGQRLVENIPAQFRHPEFKYSFTGVNLKEINAFALPGGPMFINRGMIEKAHTEGEVAGVMAHELSHVALRHGTAQQTKATPYAVGSILGQIAGAVVGGGWGQVISQGSQFGASALFLRFPREYEKQADILGTHIMAAAGYDPRDMANVFKTIEQEGGPGGPQWLSDHPNPGNRYDYIMKEAQALHVGNVERDSQQFHAVQAHLNTLPPAPSTEEVARNANAGRETGAAGAPPSGRNIPRPSSRTASYNEGNLFRVSVPSNWRELAGSSVVTFAPEGAYGTVSGNSVFTHGVEIGVARSETHDLQTATAELVQSLRQSNPRLSPQQGYDRAIIGGRQGLHTAASNVSDVTGGQEVVDIYTAQLSDGSLFYVLGVSPRDDYGVYANTFANIVRSIRFTR